MEKVLKEYRLGDTGRALEDGQQRAHARARVGQAPLGTR